MPPASHVDESLGGKAWGFSELTLAEMLRDPIVRDLMRSDGVSECDVRRSFNLRRLRNFAFAA